jgi:hypothetical protein
MINKKSTPEFTKIIVVFCVVLSLSFITGSFLDFSVKAGNQKKSIREFSVNSENVLPVNIEKSNSPWIKMKQGVALNSNYLGENRAIEMFENGSLKPTALASADINFDGFPDLISGYAGTGGGGVITLHKANKEAFAPQDEKVLDGLRRGEFPASYESKADVLPLPISPDFIMSGNFVKGSSLDLIVAACGSRSVYLLSSDGADGFKEPREIQFDGEINAIVSDRLTRDRVPRLRRRSGKQFFAVARQNYAASSAAGKRRA